MQSFLTVEGFSEAGEVVDLERNLSDYKSHATPPAVDILRVGTDADIPAMNAFFDRSEFPARWKYDTMTKVSIEGPRCVFCLFRGDQMEGFALIQDFTNKAPIGGAVWHVSMGKNWGALGAIGISKAIRGEGSGNALLGSSPLPKNSKKRSVEQCIIDWTGLVDFYGKHGFIPTRRYKPMSLALGE